MYSLLEDSGSRSHAAYVVWVLGPESSSREYMDHLRKKRSWTVALKPFRLWFQDGCFCFYTLGVLFVGVLIAKEPFLGSMLGPPDVWNLPAGLRCSGLRAQELWGTILRKAVAFRLGESASQLCLKFLGRSMYAMRVCVYIYM